MGIARDRMELCPWHREVLDDAELEAVAGRQVEKAAPEHPRGDGRFIGVAHLVDEEARELLEVARDQLVRGLVVAVAPGEQQLPVVDLLHEHSISGS